MFMLQLIVILISIVFPLRYIHFYVCSLTLVILQNVKPFSYSKLSSSTIYGASKQHLRKCHIKKTSDSPLQCNHNYT